MHQCLCYKYDLIKEDGELVSQQYHTDVGIIDILAKDKVNNNQQMYSTSHSTIYCVKII